MITISQIILKNNDRNMAIHFPFGQEGMDMSEFDAAVAKLREQYFINLHDPSYAEPTQESTSAQ